MDWLPMSLLLLYNPMFLQVTCFSCCLLHAVSCLAYSSALEMEVTCSSKRLVDFRRLVCHDIPEDRTLHNHWCENLKSYAVIFYHINTRQRSRDSVVGIATGYGLDDPGVGVWVLVGSRIFSSPRCPGRLWAPPSLLSSGYQELFSWGLNGRGVKLTTHLQLVPRSRKCGSIHPLPHMPSWHGA
jgi:hypothetical protein